MFSIYFRKELKEKKELSEMKQIIQKITVGCRVYPIEFLKDGKVEEKSLNPEDVKNLKESWQKAKEKYSEKTLKDWDADMDYWCSEGYVHNRGIFADYGMVNFGEIDSVGKLSICKHLVWHFTENIGKK